MNRDIISDICQIPLPQSFRRGLVFGTGFSLLIISIATAKNMWDYFTNDHMNIGEIPLLIFSAWGISYVVFLCVSFLLVGFKGLRGCAWAAIPQVFNDRTHKCVDSVLNDKIHICVDSVLNARQDIVQEKNGFSVELLKTDGSKLWSIGLLGLIVFAYVLIIDSIKFIDLSVKLIFIGSFSSLYFLYDRIIHTPSKGRQDLTGCRDYPKLISELLGGQGGRENTC